MSGNPFHLSKMDQVEWFYNRRSEVDTALEMLRARSNVEVMGPRRIGKSWFLRYISHPDVLRQHGLDPQRNICVYIDCQRSSIQRKEVQVYHHILERLVAAARQVGVDLEPTPGDKSAAGMAFEQALKEIHRLKLRVILLLDEFEEMAQNSNLDEIFFNNLRSFANADDVDVVYVTASQISLGELQLKRDSLLSSPFFNIFQQIRLGLFDEQDSRHLVEDSLRRAGADFLEDLVEQVLETSGGHPFFLQIAGQYAFRLVATVETLTDDARETFLRKVNREAKRHFEYYWQKLDLQDQYVLAALPLLGQAVSYRETVERLRDACLITRRNNDYVYFSPLLERFVRHQQVKHLLQAGPLLIDERRKRVLLRGNPLDLSPTNRALLIRLMQQAGQVISYQDLWHAVWSEEPHNLIEQVKSGIRSLRNALGDDAGCIVNRRGVGYMFQTPSE